MSPAGRLLRRCIVLVAAWLAAVSTWAVEASTAPVQVLVMLRSPPAHARLDGVYGGSAYSDAARQQSQRRVGARIALAHGFSVVTQWPIRTLGMDCMVLQLPSGTSLEQGVAALQAHDEVAWAQAMNEFQAQGHGDPLYPLQPVASRWRLDDLHAVATGRDIRIAVVDSGVDAGHPDLADAVETSRNFVDGQALVPEWHGTAVAGLIAARADNGIGMVGVAPGARLLALRACREASRRQTLCDTLSLAKALDYAIERRAEVINMSLSGPFDPLLARLIDVAISKREQVVAAVDAQAAGGGFPADHAGVVAVSDSLEDPPRPGTWSAPARDLPTTVPGGAWRFVTGSSFAAGQVSGLLAVLAQARAAAHPDGRAADPLVRLPGGGIDACASLTRVVAAAGRPPEPTASACGTLLSKEAGIDGG